MNIKVSCPNCQHEIKKDVFSQAEEPREYYCDKCNMSFCVSMTNEDDRQNKNDKGSSFNLTIENEEGYPLKNLVEKFHPIFSCMLCTGELGNNKPMKQIYCIKNLNRICRQLNIRKINWHMFRHTFASHLANKNISLQVIQHFLGHSDIRTTMRYAHLSPETLKESIKVLEKSNIKEPFSLIEKAAYAAIPSPMGPYQLM